MAGIDLSNEAALTDAQRAELARIYSMPDAKLAYDLDAVDGITYSATKQDDGSVACIWQIGKNIVIAAEQKSNIFAVMQAFNALRFGNAIVAGSIASNPQDGSYHFTTTGEAGDYFVNQAQTHLERKNKTPDFDGYQTVLKHDQTRGHWVAYIHEVPTISALGSNPALALDQLREAFSLVRESIQPDSAGGTLPNPIASAPQPLPQAPLDSCSMGACFQPGIESMLTRATGLAWSVAPEGGAYIAKGDRITLEALAAQMRPHLHQSVLNKDQAITIEGEGLDEATLRITRGACETGNFAVKCAAAFRKDQDPCYTRRSFMTALSIEQLEKLTPYSFTLKDEGATATLNADSARGLQASLLKYGQVESRLTELPAAKDTPQRERKATLTIPADRTTLEKLRALQTNRDFKTAFDYETINHIAAATSAFRR